MLDLDSINVLQIGGENYFISNADDFIDLIRNKLGNDAADYVTAINNQVSEREEYLQYEVEDLQRDIDHLESDIDDLENKIDQMEAIITEKVYGIKSKIRDIVSKMGFIIEKLDLEDID